MTRAIKLATGVIAQGSGKDRRRRWHYLDITSDSRFYSLLLPFLFLVFLLAAVIKLAIKLGPGSDGGGSGDFGGGRDSGGGDC